MEMVPDPDDVVLDASYDAYLGAGGENNCDAYDRDDLDDDEDQEDTTFHEKIQKDLQNLIGEIRSKANSSTSTQNASINPVSRAIEEKEVMMRICNMKTIFVLQIEFIIFIADLCFLVSKYLIAEMLKGDEKW